MNNRFSGEANFVYAGEDLQAMDNATNYHQWIIDKFKHYPASVILEVGAGSGTFTAHLAKNFPQSKIIALEPSNEMFPLLQKRTKECTNVEIKQAFTADLTKELQTLGITMIIYNNVLEHIDDDVEELKLAYSLLTKDGVVVTYSPALTALYSKFDENLGHYRRYSLQEKVQKITEAGFKVREKIYCDGIGMILWWLKYKLLGSTKLESGSVAWYDKFIVPIITTIEPKSGIPIGKNIFVVGKKV